MLEETARSLPAWALHPATAVLLLLVLRAAWKTPHASGKLLIFVIWLRYVMQAYHEFTYVTFGGVSLNAMASLAVCVVGAAVLVRRLPELGRFPLMILLLGVITLSGLINGALVPTIETLLKWGYFAVVMLATIDCIRRDGDARIFGLLLWACAPALVYQGLSIALDIGKATESDGSVSYIGGYNHEASFSIVLLTGAAVASLSPRLNILAAVGVIAICLGGVVLANYRTSLIAAIPLVCGFLIFGAAHFASPGRRVVISLVGVLAIMGAASAASLVMSDRLAELGVVAEQGTEIVKAPGDFSEAERKLLSGRLYLWNLYVEDYAAGNDITLLLGYGADSWVEKFALYAHNTLVSYLHEFGILGVLLILSVWMAMLARAFRVPEWTLRGQLASAHIGFILLNLATMPFWQIEGLILYGLLRGYTVAATTQVVHQPVRMRPVVNFTPRRWRTAQTLESEQ